jgi:RNA polymerase sigma-70 factor (ECF subfamily)
MEPEADLETLMVRYQQGDTAAATALIQTLSPTLHRFFVVQLSSRGHADDLLQETWLRIHAVRHTYRPGERVLPWLYAIARHVRIDHYRRVHRREMREQPLDSSQDFASAERPVDSLPDVAALLGVLPESQREVIAMLKLSNMTLEEVARATSSTVGSVKQKAHRAYTRLRELLAGKGSNPVESGGRRER